MDEYQKEESDYYVALRKESVDRNRFLMRLNPTIMKSLSARRAWIEIRVTISYTPETEVALRKESVDRNKGPEELAQFWACRSPQGERG